MTFAPMARRHYEAENDPMKQNAGEDYLDRVLEALYRRRTIVARAIERMEQPKLPGLIPSLARGYRRSALATNARTSERR